MADDARRVAVTAIVRIDTEGAYANVVLPKLLDDTDLDGRDRAFVTELVYGSTRRRRALDHVIDRFLVQEPPPVARAGLRVGAHQLIEMGTPAHAAVSATVAAVPKRYRGLLNAVLRRVAEAAEQGIDYPSEAIELSYPDWIVERLVEDLGHDAAFGALATMNEPAVVQRRADGYVQDESSRQVAALVPSAPGDLVLDLCAAPGGKATEIAGRGADVVACDIHPGRAGLIVANAARLGLDRVAVVQADGTRAPFRPDSFDAALVDAPCSGLGALRRRPDARWRIQPSDIENLAELQKRLLTEAAGLVRPGGTLVYSVCTLTAAESAGVVAAAGDALARAGFEVTSPLDVFLPGPDHDGMSQVVWQRR